MCTYLHCVPLQLLAEVFLFIYYDFRIFLGHEEENCFFYNAQRIFSCTTVGNTWQKTSNNNLTRYLPRADLIFSISETEFFNIILTKDILLHNAIHSPFYWRKPYSSLVLEILTKKNPKNKKPSKTRVWEDSSLCHKNTVQEFHLRTDLQQRYNLSSYLNCWLAAGNRRNRNPSPPTLHPPTGDIYKETERRVENRLHFYADDCFQIPLGMFAYAELRVSLRERPVICMMYCTAGRSDISYIFFRAWSPQSPISWHHRGR